MLNWLRPQASAPATRDETDDFWFTQIGPRTGSGVMVTHQTAMSISAVYACVRLIAETAGQLPFGVFSREENGDKHPEIDHPLHEVLHDQPNDEHTAMEFREMLTSWAASRGTGVAEIVPGRRGAVDQLIPLHPDYLKAVKVEDASGRVRWHMEFKEPDAPKRVFMRDELFILRAFAQNPDCPLIGIDPVMAQAATLGAVYAANDYASRFFGNDARPALVITHPGNFRDQESRNVFKRAWNAAFRRSGAHSAAVLEWGMDVKTISITPEQAQFLETRKLGAEDVARIFRVQPHKIGIMEHATFGNIEHQAIEFVIDTMMPWLIRWEQAVRRDLITNKRRFFAEHNVAGLLRGDIKARYEAYAIGRQWGWLNVDDVRRLENMNAVDGGDRYLEPMNMRELGADIPDPPELGAREPAAPPGRNEDGGDPDKASALIHLSTRPNGMNGAHHHE